MNEQSKNQSITKSIYIGKLVSRDDEEDIFSSVEAESQEKAIELLNEEYTNRELDGKPEVKILLQHFENNRNILLQLAKNCEIAKHPLNLGTAREGVISNFLQQNLSENIAYHTGELFNRDNQRSGQLDIILHPISSPKIHLYSAINIFPIETVLGVIEVKSNLTTDNQGKSHLAKAIESCKKVKKLADIPFILFAYNGAEYEKLLEKLKNEKEHYLPDLIIVLEKGYFVYKSSIGKKINIPHFFKKYPCEDENSSNEFLEDSSREPFLVGIHEKYVLLSLFEYLDGIIQSWFNESNKPKSFSIKEYSSRYDSNLLDWEGFF